MKHNKMRKRGTAVLAIVCAIVIIITGTFAFQTMVQQGWGQVIARDQFPGGRLHIDKEVIGESPDNNFGEMHWRPGMSANEEIYVENFDENMPIFVRVRLYEYLEAGPGAELHPNDPDFMAREAEPLIAGADRLNTATWTAILPDAEADSDSAQFRNYWTLTQAGGSKWFMPTFNQDILSREPDVKGDAWGLVPTLPELPNSTRRGELPHAVIDTDTQQYIEDQPYAYSPDAGISDYFELNREWVAAVKSYNWDFELHEMATSPVTHTAKKTLDAKIMTMAEWNIANQPIGDIWVLDTDGWAYWASSLEPGEATGLLINGRTYIFPIVGTMYYALYADAQIATSSQLPMAWDLTASNAPMSTAAAALVKIISNA